MIFKTMDIGSCHSDAKNLSKAFHCLRIEVKLFPVAFKALNGLTTKYISSLSRPLCTLLPKVPAILVHFFLFHEHAKLFPAQGI